jgi:cytoskeletal protein CcmA (bactofilin family)
MEITTPSWSQRIRRKAQIQPKSQLPVADTTPTAPPTAVVEQGFALEGRLVMERPIRVEGDFRGTIECSDTVVVAEGGSVEGDIRAHSVVIHGAVVGNITATRSLLLRSIGKLHGDVITPSFEMERGAFFNGQTQMQRPQDRGWRRVESPHSEREATPQRPA